MRDSVMAPDSGGGAASQGDTSTSTVAGGLPPLRDIETLDAKRISGSPYPDWIAVSENRVWVSGVDPGLVYFDTDTQRKLGEHRFENVALDMEVGFGSVWVGSGDSDGALLGRLNASTGQELARIRLPSPRLAEESSVGAGEDGVWVLSDAEPRELIVVDPHSNEVRTVVPAPTGAAAVRAGLGAVWVTTSSPGSLVRLDPRSGAEVATVRVGNGARFLALNQEAVWVMNQIDGTVSRVDPDSNSVIATISVTATPILGGDIAATDTSVWLRVNDALAVRIDPRVNKVTDRLGPAAGSGGIGVTPDSVWIAAHDVLSIWCVPIR
jgi:YVTN family beta-propeller protein